MKSLISSILPRGLYRALVKPYHFLWAWLSAVWYGFPGKKLTVIGVTGTKGKSSVAEMLFTILTAAGNKAALAGTIRFAVGEESEPNLYKMTVPGRGFLQQFLAGAVKQGATHAVLELTSEAALQYRHLFLDQDVLVFTNLQKEHLESHGGMENYFRAKLRIGKALARSPKRPRAIVANADDAYGLRFLELPVESRIPFSYKDAKDAVLKDGSVSFMYGNTRFDIPHPGAMSAMNALAAVKTAEFLCIPPEVSARALGGLVRIPGRAENIDVGQPFLAVVDYAHTPDSLEALYAAYPTHHRKICVLGNTGGGRDSWKRPLMGKIAEEHCTEVILTDEDPYDEDPRAIVDAMKRGMEKEPTIIMDRREAIRHALSIAKPGDAVLITGKGTDPFIMGARGAKTPWSDAQVVKEELERLGPKEVS
jgi:UDP-N-acetylmuramoyl-L-alanyl-D-glutamate--2,6-diaminopimelate ligase